MRLATALYSDDSGGSGLAEKHADEKRRLEAETAAQTQRKIKEFDDADSRHKDRRRDESRLWRKKFGK